MSITLLKVFGTNSASTKCFLLCKIELSAEISRCEVSYIPCDVKKSQHIQYSLFKRRIFKTVKYDYLIKHDEFTLINTNLPCQKTHYYCYYYIYFILYTKCCVYCMLLYMYSGIMYVNMYVYMYTYMHMHTFCFKYSFTHFYSFIRSLSNF